jgi:hypothetical protein
MHLGCIQEYACTYTETVKTKFRKIFKSQRDELEKKE